MIFIAIGCKGQSDLGPGIADHIGLTVNDIKGKWSLEIWLKK